MSEIISTLAIFVTIFNLVKSDYSRHRDNVVNKGVWVKTDRDKLYDKAAFGDFIFKPSSVNVDDLFQDDFYSFGGNHVQDVPFIPGYMERSKRSPNVLERGFPKSVKNCKEKDCNKKHMANNKPIIKSKFLQKKKNPSVLSVYPYNIAVLLGNMKNNNKVMVEEAIDKSTETISVNQIDNITNEMNQSNQTNKTFEVIMANEILVENSENRLNSTKLPKRSMNKDYESEVIKKIEIVEGLNQSKSKYDRNVFDDRPGSWQQSAPDVNVYKVIPKSEEHAVVSEKGLLKLLSILTKTFKKIMKQHVEIKKIHTEMFSGKEDIDKSVSLLIRKFKDFEAKYSDLKVYNEKIQDLQMRLEAKEEYLKNKETEMSNNLMDFENQQKKFLTQQRQFYNIQKLMLSQNEKINAKQSLIAKTQSEISRRQNNFARILKKAKQVYIDRALYDPKSQSKIVNSSEIDSKSVTTTSRPFVTESVKIDLFSIPSSDSIRLQDNDKLILKDKDEHPVDDLVYKYYFNNTFIDKLMKNQILTGLLHGNKYITRSAKSKRNEAKKIKSTILIPVNNNAIDSKVTDMEGKNNIRAKRWIRHHAKGKSRRRHRKIAADYEMKDDKTSHPNINHNLIENTEKNTPTPTTIENKIMPELMVPTNIGQTNIDKANMANPFMSLEKLSKSIERQLNPFTSMAANFCNQIGQNQNPLMLGWCVEKVLRRLQNMETIPKVATLQQIAPVTSTHAPIAVQTPITNPSLSAISPVTTPAVVSAQGVTVSPTKAPKTSPSVTSKSTSLVFFPDNDELEANLKQYVIKPDNEGTVFYEGSLHASEVLGHRESDEGFSDIMPGVDSHSRTATNPLTFDLRTMRLSSVGRMNDITQKKHIGIV